MKEILRLVDRVKRQYQGRGMGYWCLVLPARKRNLNSAWLHETSLHMGFFPHSPQQLSQECSHVLPKRYCSGTAIVVLQNLTLPAASSNEFQTVKDQTGFQISLDCVVLFHSLGIIFEDIDNLFYLLATLPDTL